MDIDHCLQIQNDIPEMAVQPFPIRSGMGVSKLDKEPPPKKKKANKLRPVESLQLYDLP